MKRCICLLSVAIGMVSACGARPGMGADLQAQTRPMLYVCNQEEASISVIDMGTREVVRTIDLQTFGFAANAKPHHIAAEADGSFWYLSLIGASKVLKFTGQGELVGQVDFETPGMLGIHPTEDLLFVGRSMSAVSPPSRVGLIRRSDMSIEELEVVFPRPHMLVVDSAGAFVHTASLGENQIMTVGVEDQEVTFTAVEGRHHVLAHGTISRDGSWLVVSGELTGTLLLFDASAAPTMRLLGTLDVPARPWHLAFTPDQRFVYFGNQGANTVTVVDVDGWEVAAIVEGDGLAEPHGIAVSPDGRYVYVSNRNLKGEYRPQRASQAGDAPIGNVVVIDTNTRTIETIIDVGRGPSGIAIVPGQ